MRDVAAVSASLLPMSRFAAATALAFAAVFDCHCASIEAQVRDASGKAIPDAAIYALPASGGVDARPGKLAAIEQIDREFVPYVSIVQTGTTVTFPNRDP